VSRFTWSNGSVNACVSEDVHSADQCFVLSHQGILQSSHSLACFFSCPSTLWPFFDGASSLVSLLHRPHPPGSLENNSIWEQCQCIANLRICDTVRFMWQEMTVGKISEESPWDSLFVIVKKQKVIIIIIRVQN